MVSFPSFNCNLLFRHTAHTKDVTLIHLTFVLVGHHKRIAYIADAAFHKKYGALLTFSVLIFLGGCGLEGLHHQCKTVAQYTSSLESQCEFISQPTVTHHWHHTYKQLLQPRTYWLTLMLPRTGHTNNTPTHHHPPPPPLIVTYRLMNSRLVLLMEEPLEATKSVSTHHFLLGHTQTMEHVWSAWGPNSEETQRKGRWWPRWRAGPALAWQKRGTTEELGDRYFPHLSLLNFPLPEEIREEGEQSGCDSLHKVYAGRDLLQAWCH